jgi:predicted AAA+ superfamily ATPase
VACETAELFGRFIVGGYPEPAVHGVTPQNFYGAYLQTYLERDVRQIRSVHDLSLFQRFVEMLAARCGGILNLSDLGRSCGISHTLAQQWLSILEMTRIVYVLRPYFMNVSKRLVKSPKVYFSDTGLLCYLLKYAEPQTLWAGPSAGHVFENAMISEWLKFKANTAGLFELYFVRDAKGQEVDLLLDAGQKKIGIEFKLSAAPSLQDADGMRALLGDVLTHGYVVSCHQGTVPLNKGITAMPWYAMCADMGRIF